VELKKIKYSGMKKKIPNAIYVFIKLIPEPAKYKTGPNRIDLVVADLKCDLSTSGFNTKSFFKM
jgi:hypothetical protein